MSWKNHYSSGTQPRVGGPGNRRHHRRAKRRRASAIKSYEIMCSMPGGDSKYYTKPGSKKYW